MFFYENKDSNNNDFLTYFFSLWKKDDFNYISRNNKIMKSADMVTIKEMLFGKKLNDMPLYLNSEDFYTRALSMWRLKIGK